ncbi:MAG: serine/threonine-protein kinase [Myxococcota bacterium]
MSHGSGGSASANFGPYRLLRRAAVGGMAEVWRARYVGPGGAEDLAPGAVVAVKRLLPTAAEDPALVAGFLEEAGLMRRMRHPRIARAWDLARLPAEGGEGEGEPYLVMEYVDGRPLVKVLEALMERGETAPPEIVAAVGVQVADALAHVHDLRGDDGRRLGVVHRDVSPHNLMWTPDGAVKLVDFGIAKFAGRSRETQAGVVKGKHAYMSPEQVARGPLDGRSDLFSLGVSLWELAAGRRLFRADSMVETLERVVEARVPSLSEVAPDLPEPLARVITACLAREPEGRPDSARDVSAAFGRWLSARGLRAEAVLAAWYAEHMEDDGRIEGPTLDEYRAGLRAAEHLGEETTDQRGVPDATTVFAPERVDAGAPEAVRRVAEARRPEASAPHEWRRKALVGVAWLVAGAALAFTLATTLWAVDRMSL